MEPTISPDVAGVTTAQVVLLLDDDPIVTEGLSAVLERRGRTIITCNDLESAELGVEWLSPSHIVADVRLSGPFGYEGLDFIRYARRHAPNSRVILMTGDASEALRLEASERGAVAFLEKPFGGSQLDGIINVMSPSGAIHDTPPVFIRFPGIDEILGGSLYSMFQPVVNLKGDEPFGHEALSRCRIESPLQNPALLFKYAERKNRVCDLELACMSHSIEAAARLPAEGLVFLNVHPETFSSGSRLAGFLSSGVSADLLSRLVLEVTEQAPLRMTPEALEGIERIRSLGVRFAFDDFGIAYSHLALIDQVRPQFLKISQEFGTRFETDPTRVKIVRNIVSIANDFGCSLILEGIEDASTADAARELGIELGQGYFFGRPAELFANAE